MWTVLLFTGDRDDISRYADRILARAMTVEVMVRTDRDPQQEEALHQVCFCFVLDCDIKAKASFWIKIPLCYSKIWGCHPARFLRFVLIYKACREGGGF